MFLMVTATIPYLRAVVFLVWTALGVSTRPDAPVIADAIVQAAYDSPIESLGTAGTAAVMAEYAFEESSVRLHPVPARYKDGRLVDGLAGGVWQLHGPAGSLAPIEQARAWLRLAHAGERECPAHPLGPLSGSCRGAWKLAERRIRLALDLAKLGSPEHRATLSSQNGGAP
jgi:hypothetical protein